MRSPAEHPLIAHVRTRLAQHAPVEESDRDARPAAVAIALRPDGDDLDVLFIRRAEYASDPWSGQVAFPGGRQEPGDTDLLETALRETREETGIDLRSTGQVIGRLDDLHSRTIRLPNVFVRPYVLATGDVESFQLSSEVADAFWVPLSVLKNGASWRLTTVQARGLTFDVSACHFEGMVIWGMTERILSQLLLLIA